MELRDPIIKRKSITPQVVDRPILVPEPKATISSPAAFDRAYTEALAVGDPASLSTREAEQQEHNILDESISLMYKEVEMNRLLDDGQLKGIQNRPVEEQIEVVTAMFHRMDAHTVTPRLMALMAVLPNYPKLPYESFEDFRRQIPTSDVKKSLDAYRAQRAAALRQDIVEFSEQHDLEGFWNSLDGFGAGELLPFVSVLSRWGLSRELLDKVAPDAEIGFLRKLFTGEVRQALRDSFVNDTPTGRAVKIKEFLRVLEDYEKDPKTASNFTKYNLREHLENLLTDDVIQGKSSKNSIDRFVGNLEVGIGSFLSTWLLTKGAKATIRSMTKVGDEATASALASTTGNNAFTGSFLELVANSDIGKKFNINKEDAVLTTMVKPLAFVDDRSILTPAQKIVAERNDRLQSQIYNRLNSTQDLGLNRTDKYNAVVKDLTKLDEQQNMEIMPAMSTVDWLADDTGYAIRAVYGQTPTKGWDNLRDLTDEVLEIDPNLQHFTVWRRGANNKLEQVFESPQDFVEAATKGELPAKDRPFNYAGVRVTDISDEDLIRISTTETDPKLLEAIEKEAVRRANTAPLKEEYFLETNIEHYWHNTDKGIFEENALTNTGVFPRFLTPPNRRFSEEIYGSTLRALLRQENAVRDLQHMAAPFFKSSDAHKAKVWTLFEWGEEFGKAEGRAPSLSDYYSKFSEITPDEVTSLMSLRDAHDTMWSLLNNKLYREYKTLGYKSAVPDVPGLPTFHGKVLDKTELRKGISAFDPVTQEMKVLDEVDIESIYKNGGSILKNDLAIDVPGSAGKAKADHIVVADKYTLSELSTSPMKYHPGYNIRLYDDPYYIVKVYENSTLNGKAASRVHTQAVRTAPSRLTAENYLRRGLSKHDKSRDIWRDAEDPDVYWQIKRAKDLDQTESTLMKKQTIQQEGRLFWDERNFDRLPDTSNSLSKLNDPVKSFEAAIGMVGRQVTHEDLIKRLMKGWENEFRGLTTQLGLAVDLNTQPIKNVVKALRAERQNVSGVGRKQLNKAIDLLQYIRAQAGMEQVAVPYMRSQVANLAYMVERWGGKKLAYNLEKLAENFDPTRTIRSIAFNLFMVFRPARQALLQSMQVGFIAPLDPLYVASGKLFRDSYGVRMGLRAFRKEADMGFSVGKRAKMMGLTTKEYRLLVKELDRSGLMESVDVHSFAGGARRYNKTALPKNAIERVTAPVKKSGVVVRDFMQEIGFNLGERNNLTMTYMIALRRALKKKKTKSFLKFTREDWDAVTKDASDLALGMVRPNNFGYQQGLLGVTTQFLSFTHKAALTLMFQNPALTKGETIRILMGSYLLYGGNIFGGRDWVEQNLRMAGLGDTMNQTIPGTDTTLLDYLAGGVIEASFNALGQATAETWQDLSIESFTPGINVTMLYEKSIQALLANPSLDIALGPFGSIKNRFLLGLDVANWIHGGDSPDMSPTDKAMVTLKAIAAGTFPAYNDYIMASVAHQMGRWYATDGTPLPVRSALNSAIARGTLGVRTLEELQYYNYRAEMRLKDKEYNEMVREGKRNIRKMILLHKDGKVSTQDLKDHLIMLHNVWDMLPPARKLQMIDAIMNETLEDEDKSITQILAEDMAKGNLDPKMQALVEAWLANSGEDPNTVNQGLTLLRDVWERRTTNEQRIHEDVKERLNDGRD